MAEGVEISVVEGPRQRVSAELGSSLVICLITWGVNRLHTLKKIPAAITHRPRSPRGAIDAAIMLQRNKMRVVKLAIANPAENLGFHNVKVQE